jgi:hypothetical protein
MVRLYQHPNPRSPRDISSADEVSRLSQRDNQDMNEAVSIIGNLLGDPGRAEMLLSLMGGVARPAGTAGTSPLLPLG